MLNGVIAELQGAFDAAGRKIGLAVLFCMMMLAGLLFAAAALWTVAASAWGPAAASLLLSGVSFTAAGSVWLAWSIAGKRGAQDAENARARCSARSEALLTAFRAGAEIGGRVARR